MGKSRIAKQFFAVEVGSEVTDGMKVYRVSHLISIDSVLAVDLATGETDKLPVETLRLIDTSAEAAEAGAKDASEKDLLEYSDEEWKQGQQRLQAIKPLLDEPMRTRREVEKIAKVEGVHVGTLYRWLATYTNAGNVSALVPSKRGRKLGTMMLDEALELILKSVIEDFYLHKQRRSSQEAIEEVHRRCRLAKVVPPHANTVRNRINRIPDRERMRRRGRKEEADNKYLAIRGSFPDADQPFSVIQIDHTPADIIVVDDVHRKPIRRPYITLAIDVHSRMVAGFYLSLDPPSAASVGLCLAQAMCPKREYLASLGVAGSWPVWGKPATVHCDNAKEFRGVVLERACEEHHVNLAFRPVKVPRYGGHIERLMGTVATELHKLPGTTFSNTKDRKGYDSMAEATLTMRDLEQHLVDFFVNVYHQRVHSELGMSPLRKWELGLAGGATTPGLGLMPLPEDPERILLDFMPFVERTVQPYGIQIDNIAYYDPVLDPYINAHQPDNSASKRSFVIRRDPRDISRVYFLEPKEKRYYVVPYRNIGHPAMSLYELIEVNRRLKEEGRRDVDEHLIFEALDRMRARVEEASQKSKSARRKMQRSPGPKGGAKVPPLMKVPGFPTKPQPQLQTHSNAHLPGGPQAHEPVIAELEDDPFAQPVRPFEELRLSR